MGSGTTWGRWIALFVATVIVVVPALAATGAPRPVSVLRVALAADTPTMGPSFSTGFPDMTRYFLMFDPLIDYAPDMKMRGRLATSWQQVSARVWEFRLRRGVRFHNGDVFTAKDVKANIEWALDPANRAPYLAYVGGVERVEVVDDYTVRFHTKDPFPTLPNQLIDRTIFPADYVARVGAAEFNRRPVGTGPFRFVEWVPGQRLVVEANPNYWDGRPQVERVEVYPIPEPSTRVAALFGGNVDIIEKPPMEFMQRLRANRELKVLTYPTLAALTFVINTKMKPLDDVRVRRAIHHAVNVDEMIVRILGGIGQRMVGQLVKGVPGHNPNLKPYDYNPGRARQLLREAGLADGFPLKIYTPTGRYLQDTELAEAVAGYLGRVGIKAQVVPIEWGTLVRALAGNPLLDGMYMIGNSQYSLDPAGMYQGYVWSDYRGVYYSRPDLDEIGRRARSEPDPAKRAELYRKMEEIVWNDAFWLPITVRVEILAMSRLVDFTPRATEYLYLREARFSR